MPDKVYGFCGTNKCRREVVPVETLTEFQGQMENALDEIENKFNNALNKKEDTIKRSNLKCLYKEGQTCHLHAWWVDAKDVFYTLGENHRPYSTVTCIGFCQRKDNAAAYPLMCELESNGQWQVWAMTSIGTTGGNSWWKVYDSTTDHRNDFIVCITGSWLTKTNGGW